MSPMSLLDRPRYEIMPLTGVLEQTAALPPGATVTVTASPRRGAVATVELTEELAARGFDAVPHLAARQLRDKVELGELLERLHRAGVRDVFVVGGDGRQPVGTFPDGLSVLRAMAEIGARPRRVGIPCYPEGHPAIDDRTLWSALLAKQSHADYTVTQMCFDPGAICRFVTAARSRGVTLPVVVGVPGPADVATLLRVGVRIGVGDSMRFLRGHRALAGGLLGRAAHRPTALVRGLHTEVRAGRCDLAGLHFYTFNRIGPTVRWWHQARRRAVA